MLDGHSVGGALRAHDPRFEFDTASAKNSNGTPSKEDVRKLPFVERRRRQSVSESWPQALDALHRHLLGLEHANRALEESENTFRELFDHAPLGLFQISADGKIQSLNRAMARILGFDSPAEVLNSESCEEFATLLPKSPKEWSQIDGEHIPFDLQLVDRKGITKWIRLHLRTAQEDQRMQYLQGTAEDVSERIRSESHTQALAYYDRLTGLPNRILFLERLAAMLSVAHERHRKCALLLLEIDRFRLINDSMGEAFGDRVLQEVAAYIRSKTSEESIVARLGSAEFAVALPHVRGTEDVEAIARSLSSGLGLEHAILGHSLNVFCNIGISIFPDHGESPESIVRNADVAQCFARENSENRCRMFTVEMNETMTERFLIDHGLRRALSLNELYLEYQPQVDIRSGAVIGVEALLRWKHSKMGVIPPNRFIAIAESNGLIVPIGEWVIRTACAQARAWQLQGILHAPVAVNVSAIQFRQQDFCETVRKVLSQTGLEAKYLELELTESLLLASADVTSQVTSELREMGVTLAIDDFGTGYSNLGYLKRFKVNRIKIDRSFIRDVPGDGDDVAITVAIIEMARALNLSVLAEGVENRAQLEFLRHQGCFVAQGYYFAKPATPEKLSNCFREGYPATILQSPGENHR